MAVIRLMSSDFAALIVVIWMLTMYEDRPYKTQIKRKDNVFKKIKASRGCP